MVNVSKKHYYYRSGQRCRKRVYYIARVSAVAKIKMFSVVGIENVAGIGAVALVEMPAVEGVKYVAGIGAVAAEKMFSVIGIEYVAGIGAVALVYSAAVPSKPLNLSQIVTATPDP